MYTQKNKLSSVVANSNISKEIKNSFSFYGKKILDFGCGDGSYTNEFKKYRPKKIEAIDIAKEAIKVAKRKFKNISFNVGGFTYLSKIKRDKFDIIIFRGVLHHLKNPANYILTASKISKTILILEPNGHNPIVKFLEKYSQYHIDHEERSFTSKQLTSWCKNSGFRKIDISYINIVPFFCPDWMVYVLKFIYPFIEKIPVLKKFLCGQILIVASR